MNEQTDSKKENTEKKATAKQSNLSSEKVKESSSGDKKDQDVKVNKTTVAIQKKDLKSSVAKQVTPNTKTENKQSDQPKENKTPPDFNDNKTQEKKKRSSVVVSLAFVVGIAGCAIAAYSLYTQHQQAKLFSTSIAQNTTEYSQLKLQTTKAIGTLDQLVSTQSQTNKLSQADKDNIASLMKKTYALDQQVKAIKSDYLLPQSDLYQQMILIQVNAAGIYLNMADNYLKLYAGGDQAISLIKAAESALINADERAKPALAMVRKAQYAVENATLFTQYDGNMQNINQLIPMLNQLKLKAPGYAKQKELTSATNTSATKESWYESFQNSIDKMANLVKIHKLDQTSKALLNSNTRENIAITLKLTLEQAKWALQRRDSIAFKQSINQAIDEVSTYYQTDQVQKKWLEIAKRIQFGQSQNYMQAMNQAIYAVSNLEAQIIASTTKGGNKTNDTGASL
ncbi:uroporphyrinogen-III C-methyltransferase [Thiotrichales bacterium 19S3-7]|nr:uroporphyrinogen-III C-methyltransferase [Thiotrichales bacterium 19S3-7]MCF6802525.1 uroporphyrinogen-III C-methyltransferase [Thiotrichales bacterium 19S3-11]